MPPWFTYVLAAPDSAAYWSFSRESGRECWKRVCDRRI